MKFLRMTFLVIAIIVLLVFTTGFLVIKFNPQFGGKPSKEELTEYEKLNNFSDGKFLNQIKTEMDMNFKKGLKVMREFMSKKGNKRPDGNLPQKATDASEFFNSTDKNLFVWFGHSAIALNLKGKIILIDPMLTKAPSPFPAFGTKRFNDNLPIKLQDFPKIDYILISHDHYDHLDMKTIKILKEKSSKFLVPLAVKPHLMRWEVDENKITEFNWYDELKFEDLMFAFAPARHFSGRGMTNRNSTLWGSWIIKNNDVNIFFSGDGGYGPHFKEIGEKYGGFDLSFIECGQYNKNWHAIHMMPEESVQAAIDAKSNAMMPVHWGAFNLALHPWDEPVIRAHKSSKEKGIDFVSPEIGAIVEIDKDIQSGSDWWEL